MQQAWLQSYQERRHTAQLILVIMDLVLHPILSGSVPATSSTVPAVRPR